MRDAGGIITTLSSNDTLVPPDDIVIPNCQQC